MGEEEIRRSFQCMNRNPIPLEKIRCIEKTGTVIFTSAMSSGRNQKKFAIFDAGEFIATIC